MNKLQAVTSSELVKFEMQQNLLLKSWKDVITLNFSSSRLQLRSAHQYIGEVNSWLAQTLCETVRFSNLNRKCIKLQNGPTHFKSQISCDV